MSNYQGCSIANRQFQHHNSMVEGTSSYPTHYQEEFAGVGNSWNHPTMPLHHSSSHFSDHQNSNRVGPSRERYLHALHEQQEQVSSYQSSSNAPSPQSSSHQKVVAYRFNPYALTSENTKIRCSPSSTPGETTYEHSAEMMDKMLTPPNSSGFLSPERSRLGTPGAEGIRGGISLYSSNNQGGAGADTTAVSPSSLHHFTVQHSWESHCVLSSVPSSMSVRSLHQQQQTTGGSSHHLYPRSGSAFGMMTNGVGQSAVMSPMIPPTRDQGNLSNMSIVTYKSALAAANPMHGCNGQQQQYQSKSGGLSTAITSSCAPCAPMAIGIVDRDNTEPLSDDLLGPRVESTYTSRRGSNASLTLPFADFPRDSPLSEDEEDDEEEEVSSGRRQQLEQNQDHLSASSTGTISTSNNSTTDIVHHQELFDSPEDITYYSFSDPSSVQYLQDLVAKHLYPRGSSLNVQSVTSSTPSPTVALAPRGTEELFMGQLSENGTLAAAALIAEKLHAPVFRVGPIWGANRVTKAREWKRCATLHVDPQHVEAFVACNRNFVCCDENGLFVAMTEAGASMMEAHTLMERGLGVPLTSVSLRKSTPLPPRKNRCRPL